MEGLFEGESPLHSTAESQSFQFNVKILASLPLLEGPKIIFFHPGLLLAEQGVTSNFCKNQYLTHYFII